METKYIQKLSKESRHIGTRLSREYHVPRTRSLQKVIEGLSPFEKVLLWVLVATTTLSILVIISKINREVTTEIPVRGGVIKEGVIGAPRFINPLIATSDTDRDLVSLLYAGLMRPSKDGTLIPDIAERYTISEDGTEYTFILRDSVKFHDGTPLTADDVVFTVETAQDPAIKSTRRADWEGVTVEKITDREVRFTLQQPYAPFLENTTLGILPRHIWLNVSPQEFAFSTFNTQPIGSGPFKLKNIDENSSGIPTRYELRAFSDYSLGRPYMNKFFMRFYANEEELIHAYETGAVTSLGAVSSNTLNEYLDRSSKLLQIDFPRIFAIFFNQNKNRAFADKEVRAALDVLVDKDLIISEILNGYGTIIDSPLPPGTVTGQNIVSPPSLTRGERIIAARGLLENAGWEFNEAESAWTDGEQLLSFTIATANTPELKRAAEIVSKAWLDAGILVEVNVFETGDLNQNIIRPRDYEALLFGEIVGRSLDLFAFWHSSQKDDPGLNIALYTNASVDELLSKARTIANKKDRDSVYRRIEDIIKEDAPAIFLYSPDFLYIIPNAVKGVDIALVATPSERFSEVHTWYTQTERVWNFFESFNTFAN
tara:strand:- start:15767 stop:17563 length:1797 start_codon:yes stop_codon:yes gene_type:complete